MDDITVICYDMFKLSVMTVVCANSLSGMLSGGTERESKVRSALENMDEVKVPTVYQLYTYVHVCYSIYTYPDVSLRILTYPDVS